MNYRSTSLAKLSLLVLTGSTVLTVGCTVSAKNQESGAEATAKTEQISTLTEKNQTSAKNLVAVGGGRITFVQNSPADILRQFYKNLREKRFRDAMMMTNLRPAVEGLTDADMQDLHSDFEPLAAQVPAEIQINGEIISGGQATVTALMPNEDTGAPELKEFKMRRENDNWVILTADEEAEKAAKKEGKNYFFALRLEVHHVEAQSMMERIAKAQMVYSMQNGGAFGDINALIQQNLLPADAQNSKSTGYRFNISVSSDKKKYWANAEPEVYGKTGKYSFVLEPHDKGGKMSLRYEDNKGAPMKAKKS